MTKRHFEAIAAILDAERSVSGNNHHVFGIACSMADMFARENPRFDRARFMEACGY